MQNNEAENTEAFPENIAVGTSGDLFVGRPGMTLRDYFAAKAMQAQISDEGLFKSLLISVDANPIEAFRILANSSYLAADAMLSARKAKS